jgi:hypothetical protein
MRWAGVAIVIALIAAPAWAQAPQVGRPGEQPPDPQGLQQPLRAPLTLTPTLSVTEEYNDNLLLDNTNRRWDFITTFTPGLGLNWESAVHRLAAVYSFTSEIYARTPEFNGALNRQSFTLDSFYKIDPTVTVSLTDRFSYDNNTNAINPQGISSGRTRSWGNTVAPAVTWRLSDVWTTRANASYELQRYLETDLQNSDIYRLELGLDRRITSQLTGTVGYEFDYISIGPDDRSTVHTPRLGFTYQVTNTITVSANGGPAFQIRDGHLEQVTPLARASYTQRLFFGSVGLTFDRTVGVAGGLGGTTENTTMAGSVQVTTLAKGLILSFAPSYTIAQSPNNSIDTRALTVPLQVTYRLTSWLSLVGAYQFFHQRSEGSATAQTGQTGQSLAINADQNRVWFGVQFGYPITFN